VLSGLIYLMNYLIGLVGDLPWSGMADIYAPWMKVVLIYLILLFGYRLLLKKEHQFLIPLLSVMLLLIAFQVEREVELLTQQKIVVYDVGRKHEAIDLINGKNHVLLCDSTLLKDAKRLKYSTDNYRIKLGLDNNTKPINKSWVNKTEGIWSDGDFIVFNGISIVRVSDTNFYSLSKPLPVGWVLVSGNQKSDIDKLQQTFLFKKVILEPSVYKRNVKEIAGTFAKRGVPVYSVGQYGAFVYNIHESGSFSLPGSK